MLIIKGLLLSLMVSYYSLELDFLVVDSPFRMILIENMIGLVIHVLFESEQYFVDNSNLTVLMVDFDMMF